MKLLTKVRLYFRYQVKPEIVVVSCLNQVKNPAEITNIIYSQVGSKVYATCWNGKVQVVSDGNTCTVTTDRNDNQ